MMLYNLKKKKKDKERVDSVDKSRSEGNKQKLQRQDGKTSLGLVPIRYSNLMAQ